MDIGHNIKKLREIRGYSQEYVANKVDLSQKGLSRIENGEVSPTYDMMLAICSTLEITIQELLNFNEAIIFNNIATSQTGGEYIAYNNTNIKEVKELYEKLLQEKERTIEILQSQVKN